MESRVKLFGHPVHQQLIVFPLGLLATAVVFDTVYLLTDRYLMAVVSYWLIIAGLIGGLVAAPFGTIDWLAIPSDTRAKRIGLMHGISNLFVLVVFFGSWYVRRGSPQQPPEVALFLSYAGAVVSLLGAWLGGELVSRLGVAVSDGANLNASNSMSGKPARAGE
jgi:uncharacterized membrane protein